jgi:hypothetical protein
MLLSTQLPSGRDQVSRCIHPLSQSELSRQTMFKPLPLSKTRLERVERQTFPPQTQVFTALYPHKIQEACYCTRVARVERSGSNRS